MRKFLTIISVHGLALILFACGGGATENAAPENTAQKAARMTTVLRNVGLGKLDADTIRLSAEEKKIMDSLISLNPSGYNAAQRSLGNIQSDYYPLEKLLVSVGLGKMNADTVAQRLTPSQKNAIDSIISLAPDSYNATQKKLGNQK